jgi:hypothetical protein
MALMTPPVAPPNSALYPDDLTCTSWMKSTSIVLPETPFCRPVVSMPSMMNRFSDPDAPSIWVPPAFDSALAPGATWMTSVKSRPFGMRSIISLVTVAKAAFCLTSMSGDSPVTCTVSATPPTDIVMSILSSRPSDRTALIFCAVKPCSVAVIV